MTAPDALSQSEKESHYERLRIWAKDSIDQEAAVELLIRGYDGKLALPHWPWIISREGMVHCWVDNQQIAFGFLGLSATADVLSELPECEQQYLRVVRFFLDPSARLTVSEIIGQDRKHLELILAALSHAAGTHREWTDIRNTVTGSFLVRGNEGGALYPWPVTS